MALGIESLFIPAQQPYRNGTIENFNGLFQQHVVDTQDIENKTQLQHAITVFEVAANTQHPHGPLNGQPSEEYEHERGFKPHVLAKTFTFAPRTPFTVPPEGKVSFICRIRKSGKITIASEKFEIDPELAWDYVYAPLVVKEQILKIYHNGTMIKEFPYEFNT